MQRKQWHPTPVLLPGKSHGRRSLVGCSPWGCERSDTTERLHFHFSLSCLGEGNDNPLQCSCLENPRDGRAWWAAICGVAQSRTQLKRLSSSSSSSGRDSVRFIWEEPETMIRVPGVAFVQLLSRVQLFVTPWTAAHQALLSLTVSWSCPVYDHWVGDIIQPSPSLLPLSPFAFNLFQHQSLFQWVSSSHQVAKLLELQLQQQSFHRIFRIDFL